MIVNISMISAENAASISDAIEAVADHRDDYQSPISYEVLLATAIENALFDVAAELDYYQVV